MAMNVGMLATRNNELMKRFQSWEGGWQNVADNACSGRASTATCIENKEHID
jgi:hypothetical protein